MPSIRLHLRSVFGLLIAAVAILAGCDSDKRLVELSQESLKRQAEQNNSLAQQSQAVTQTTRELIKAQTEVQNDATQQQQQLHEERSTLDQQRQSIQAEGRALAAQRQRDPIIAESIKGGMLVLVAALPLLACLYLVRSLFLATSDDVAAAEVLIEGLATHQPLLEQALGVEPILEAPHQPLLDQRQREHVPRLPANDRRTDLSLAIVVEGSNDVAFLKRISAVLSQSDRAIANLGQLEAGRHLAFVMTGASSVCPIPAAVCGSGPAEFHLYDRETSPLTEQRQRLVEQINRRPGCRAVLMSKRSIENYLHPAAIEETAGIQIEFGDEDDVAELAARAVNVRQAGPDWDRLSPRGRRRLRDKTKRWLNRDAVDRMTPGRLAERDPQGELRGWLGRIAELLEAPA